MLIFTLILIGKRSKRSKTSKSITDVSTTSGVNKKAMSCNQPMDLNQISIEISAKKPLNVIDDVIDPMSPNDIGVNIQK